MEVGGAKRRLLKVTFCVSVAGLLWGIIYILYEAKDETHMIRVLENVAKLEIRYTRYKGAHHDIYLTADRPPGLQDEPKMPSLLSLLRATELLPKTKYLDPLPKKNVSQVFLTRTPSNLQPFLITLGEKDVAILNHLLTVFLQLTACKNITYMLHGGSLIGSYRHHGLIPWDTDVDVWVDVKDKGKLINSIHELGSKYEYVLHYDRLIFYVEHTTQVKNQPWKFPYIDFSFFNVVGEKVVDTDEKAARKFTFPKQLIFPLVQRPFWGRIVAAPRISPAVIQRNYNLSVCATNMHNHKLGIPNVFHSTIYCKLLYRYLPFVFRRNITSFTHEEELKVGNLVLHTVNIIQ